MISTIQLEQEYDMFMYFVHIEFTHTFIMNGYTCW